MGQGELFVFHTCCPDWVQHSGSTRVVWAPWGVSQIACLFGCAVDPGSRSRGSSSFTGEAAEGAQEPLIQAQLLLPLGEKPTPSLGCG